MPAERHRHLPERTELRLRVALVGLLLVREPEPCYKLFYRINMLNTGRSSVRVMGRKWILQDALGHTKVVEATGVFNDAPVLTPGAVFSFSGHQNFEQPPLRAELRLFGQTHAGHPFITPPLALPTAPE